MFQKPTTNPFKPPAGATTPWSPFVVAFITLFLPAGGIVLAIRNLQRLGQLEARAAAQLVWAALVVLTVGYACIMLTATRGSDGIPKIDPNTAAFLSVGLGMTAYLTVRRPFSIWRSDSRDRPASWLPAIAMALMYQLVVIACVVVLVLILAPVTTPAPLPRAA